MRTRRSLLTAVVLSMLAVALAQADLAASPVGPPAVVPGGFVTTRPGVAGGAPVLPARWTNLPREDEFWGEYAASADGTAFARAGGDLVEAIDTARGTVIARWRLEGPDGRRGAAAALAVNADGTRVAVAESDSRAVRVFDRHGKQVQEVQFPLEGASALAFNARGTELAAALNAEAAVASLSSGRVTRRLGLLATNVAFDPRTGNLAVLAVQRDEKLPVVSWPVFVAVYPPGATQAARKWPSAHLPDRLAYSPDGLTLVAGSTWGVEAFDAASGRSRWALETGEFVRSLAYSPDGRTLAVGLNVGFVSSGPGVTGLLVRAATGAPVAQVVAPGDPTGWFVAFTARGERLLVTDALMGTIGGANLQATLSAMPPAAPVRRPLPSVTLPVTNPRGGGLRVGLELLEPDPFAPGDAAMGLVPVRVRATSSADGFLYVIALEAGGDVDLLLPNGFKGGGAATRAGLAREVPDPASGQGFAFDPKGVRGHNGVYALATKRPINLDAIGVLTPDVDVANARLHSMAELTAALQTALKDLKPDEWAIAGVAFDL